MVDRFKVVVKEHGMQVCLVAMQTLFTLDIPLNISSEVEVSTDIVVVSQFVSLSSVFTG